MNLNRTVPDVIQPLHAETLFRPHPAVNEDGRCIPQQVSILFSRLLATLHCADSFECMSVRLLKLMPQGASGVEVLLLFSAIQNTFPVVRPRKHSHARKRGRDLTPFKSEMKNSPQCCQVGIECGNLEFRSLPMRHEVSHLLCGDFVQTQLRQL